MLKKLEHWYTVLAILFFAGGLIPTQRAQSEKSASLNQLNTLLQAVVFAVLLLIVFANFRSILRALARVKNIVLLCLIVLLSSVWSILPAFTIRRAVIFCGMTLFVIYFSERFSFADQVSLMYRVIVFEIIATLLLGILAPSYGISSDLHAGAWKGLFIHKNNLGQFMGISVLFLVLTKPPGRLRLSRGVLLAAAFLLLYLSHSATPLFGVILVFSLLAVLVMSRVQKQNNLPIWIGLTPFLISVGTLLIFIRDSILESAGKDSTLTGRLPLWEATMKMIGTRPWLGFGYAAFWETQNIYALGVRNMIRWPGAPHAHNGYIDTLVDVGILGFGVFAIGYCISLAKAFHRARNKVGIYSAWPLAFLLFFGFYNLTESNLIQSHTFMWVPFVWVTCELAKTSQKQSERPVRSAEFDEKAEEITRYA